MDAEPPIWEQRTGEDLLEAMRREYASTGHPWFLVNAMEICYERECPPPSWLIEDADEALETKARKRPGQGARSPSETATQAKIDWIRALTVKLLHASGEPKPEVYQAAADYLANDPPFAGSDTAIRKSYKRVLKREG